MYVFIYIITDYHKSYKYLYTYKLPSLSFFLNCPVQFQFKWHEMLLRIMVYAFSTSLAWVLRFITVFNIQKIYILQLTATIVVKSGLYTDVKILSESVFVCDNTTNRFCIVQSKNSNDVLFWRKQSLHK